MAHWPHGRAELEDKGRSIRVVTPRFSPSPPLRYFSQSIPAISANRRSLCTFLPPLTPSFLSLLLVAFLVIHNRSLSCHVPSFPCRYSHLAFFFFIPALVRPLLHRDVCLDGNWPPRALPQTRTSLARCPFISSSLRPPHPPLIRSLTLPPPRHGFRPRSLRR